MLKGFKEFLMRGNIVELAVAVVIGTAFTAIVTAFTESLIQPLINAIGGSDAAQGLGFRVLSENGSTFLDFGSVINAAVNFVIIAAVVYFLVVLPFQKLQERRKRGQEEEVAPTDTELLTEIRDLLRERQVGDRS
ncbi:large-conductance mechanosensitive channel protein MscL [Prauserella rugosa]|uniref:Large-conductance mechanosensitive channel n=1 Tax=Prauserella rugosa TaxID=43354 RepID=A0A660CBC7_9PSEU|nr:large-conductance mechanosensitive channel protein MscL [Prauserella rugosa]KID31890.1 large conductance mechanosensitive channel protein [Prauserella sp. Am3]KMS65929.1 mechanosensitive ion channel protein MscL [Streptomyces regensis]TWH20858.1 large conductance mechanosensitive channel [Prauserella rugosa]